MEAYPDVLAAAQDVREHIADVLAEVEIDSDEGFRAATDAELAVLREVIDGLIHDETFLAKVARWRNLVAGYQRGSGGA